MQELFSGENCGEMEAAKLFGRPPSGYPMDCARRDTDNTIHGGGGNVYPNGGAIGVNGATVRVRGSTFGNNWIQMVHARAGGGGAVAAVSCPSVEIDHCTFMTNYARRSSGKDDYTSGNQRIHGPYGGTVYFSGCTSATISDCTFFGGWNNAYDATYTDHNWGGLMAEALAKPL